MKYVHNKNMMRTIGQSLTREQRRGLSVAKWVAAAWEKHQSRRSNSTQPAGRQATLIHLCDNQLALADSIYGRARNREQILPSSKGTYRREIGHGRYSSRCKFTRFTYEAHVESWCYISPCRRFIAYRAKMTDGLHHGGMYVPKGYLWQEDDRGMLMLVQARSGIEYHPTIEDIEQGKAHLRRCVLESLHARRRAENQQQAMESTMVTFADARRAGNCAAGIIAFCRRNGIEFHRVNCAVPYRKIMQFASGNESALVANAAKCAYERETLVSI